MSTSSIDSRKEENVAKKEIQYQLLPPEGGWGYVIAGAVALAVNVTAQPMSAFGLIFGNFLAGIGDETTGTALANGMFNTVFSFTGLLSNILLQKYSYRTVGLMGSIIYVIGSFSTIFVTNLFQIVVSFGVIQGVGFGLLLPSVYSALNSYFDKKINLVMGLCQALMAAESIFAPILAKLSMDVFGFRATVALLAVLSLNCFPAALSLQPVRWHLIKKPILENKNLIIEDVKRTKSLSLCDEVLKSQIEPLVEEGMDDLDKKYYLKFLASEPRPSICSIGEKFLSISTTNEMEMTISNGTLYMEKTEVKTMDWSLFKDPVFLNISIGMSLSFTSDVAFISIMPMILSEMGFTTSDIATAISIFFISDLTSRILLSVSSTMFAIRNRYVFLVGTALSAAFRCGFVISTNYTWIIFLCCALGFLRCFIQTPLPLVLTEEYPTNFSTAFSLFMVICGAVSLIFGPLMSFTKSYTGSNDMVIHVLTLAFIICTISWTFELLYYKLKSKKDNHI